ncbi:MAG: DUF4012 domain-containing protein [Candidatus Moraniibacteriota bacterium]|nr:MAG: DUF4012 domain-containing protein [Candidatus Moranbacteria bacterium]
MKNKSFLHFKNKKNFSLFLVIVFVVVGGIIIFSFKGVQKTTVLLNAVTLADATMKFLPINQDTKDLIGGANAIAHSVLKGDSVKRRYLILLQNQYELRPGGGFLGQYAVVEVLNGEVGKLFVEDANLLDQRIYATVPAPYPFKQMIGIKNWKFRDSNFSPDFPTNVEKIKYFYGLSGGNKNFDGVIAVNAEVLNRVLEITGPLRVPGYSTEFTSENAAWKLQEIVEKAYLGDDVSAEAKEQRKNIIKVMAPLIIDKLMSIDNISKLVDFSITQMQKKNIMLWFQDEELQQMAKKNSWDGSVNTEWDGDYLMAVDSNMGALKSDYYMKRSIEYLVDISGEVPTATFVYTYEHTAPYGDWRTSDYHSYLRLYVPQGSVLLSREMVGSPITKDEFGKTYFGAKVDVLIGGSTKGKIVYQLPEKFKNPENYRILLQKQSGLGDVPLKLTIKTSKGEFSQSALLEKDASFQLTPEAAK